MYHLQVSVQNCFHNPVHILSHFLLNLSIYVGYSFVHFKLVYYHIHRQKLFLIVSSHQYRLVLETSYFLIFLHNCWCRAYDTKKLKQDET